VAISAILTHVTAPPHEQLIRRILGSNYLELKLRRLVIDEKDHTTEVKVSVLENNEQSTEVEGKGVGVLDALHHGLLARYAREYQSLNSIQLVGFTVAADIEATKKAQAGVDAVGRVTIDMRNSEGKHFTFSDASRSVTISIARATLGMVQHFVNAERAFVTLHNARRDALARNREDLVARYTAEMALVVESTSYADVIENIRKEL
jgi:predicted nucleic acid-binding OB-fold protein